MTIVKVTTNLHSNQFPDHILVKDLSHVDHEVFIAREIFLDASSGINPILGDIWDIEPFRLGFDPVMPSSAKLVRRTYQEHNS